MSRQNEGGADGLDRRRDIRSCAVLFMAKVVSPNVEGICLVRNISQSGAWLKTSMAIDPGVQITIEFGPGLTISGIARWRQGGRVGFQFDDQIDTDLVMHAIGGKDWHLAPGLQRHVPATVSSDQGHGAAMLRSISLWGVCIEAQCIRTLAPGSRVTVSVKGFLNRTGRVIWRQDRYVGVEFDEALPFSKLDHWIARPFLVSLR